VALVLLSTSLVGHWLYGLLVTRASVASEVLVQLPVGASIPEFNGFVFSMVGDISI
jgi:hypothetical protein